MLNKQAFNLGDYAPELLSTGLGAGAGYLINRYLLGNTGWKRALIASMLGGGAGFGLSQLMGSGAAPAQADTPAAPAKPAPTVATPKKPTKRGISLNDVSRGLGNAARKAVAKGDAYLHEKNEELSPYYVPTISGAMGAGAGYIAGNKGFNAFVNRRAKNKMNAANAEMSAAKIRLDLTGSVGADDLNALRQGKERLRVFNEAADNALKEYPLKTGRLELSKNIDAQRQGLKTDVLNTLKDIRTQRSKIRSAQQQYNAARQTSNAATRHYNQLQDPTSARFKRFRNWGRAAGAGTGLLGALVGGAIGNSLQGPQVPMSDKEIYDLIQQRRSR